jgi:cyclic pyranopterin phosphate synthase
MDKFGIDSHKLMYHVSRVSQWLEGKETYPIYLEISPSGSCNHRCKFCAFDFLNYKPNFIDRQLLKDRLFEMSRLGVRSILYAGEGEPFLHKDMAKIINDTKKVGIDVAVATNGVFLNRKTVDSIIGSVSWIKVSINAGTSKTYAKIHKTSPEDFDKVINNLCYAVKMKKQGKHSSVIGMQTLLLPENSNEMLILAKKAKSIGVDYLVVKPYSQHPLSRTDRYSRVKYKNYMYLADELAKLNDKNFNTIFRVWAMNKWDNLDRGYSCCYACSFWAYIDAGGNVWACSTYRGDKRFLYGNINKNTFKQIWESTKAIKLRRMFKDVLGINKCRINCRMDEINRYLWRLKNPPEHVNFI